MASKLLTGIVPRPQRFRLAGRLEVRGHLQVVPHRLPGVLTVVHRGLDGDLVKALELVIQEPAQSFDLRELRLDRDDAEYLSTFFIAESWFMSSVKTSLFSAIITVTMPLYVARRLR